MESCGEGQPSPFARCSFQKISPNGLRVPPYLARALTREKNTNAEPETQQQSPDNLPVLQQQQISSTLQTASAEIGYTPEMVSYAAVPQTRSINHVDIGCAPFDLGDGRYASCEVPQSQETLLAPSMSNVGLPQLGVATSLPLVPPLPAMVGPSNHYQYPNFNNPVSFYDYQGKAPGNHQNVPSSQIAPGRAIHGNAMVAHYASNIPQWKTTSPQEAQAMQAAQATAFLGISTGNMVTAGPLDRGIPLSHSHTLSPTAPTYGQPIESRPVQPYTANIPLSECIPSISHVGYVGSDRDHMQALRSGGNLRQYQSQSIDVDNDANNYCGGINRKVPEKPIDLSKETNEPKKLKRKGRKKETVSQQELTRYRIPHKSDDGALKLVNGATNSDKQGNSDGASKTRFQDPLCQLRRPHTGPPMRPFSSPAPVNSPAQKPVGRRANSKNREADKEPTDSSKQAHQSDANVDVPLGGLGKDTRELGTETSGFRSRNRSNNKRRRPSSGSERDGLSKESNDRCRTEKRRNTITHSKRRTNHDGKNNKPKKQASTIPLTRACTTEEAANEDSDELSEMIRNKRMTTIRSRRIPAQSHGDSPVSNTIGDASQSDDDSLGAMGNELSSDDDETSAKSAPRQLRTSRKKVLKAITTSDSPEKRKTMRAPGSDGTPQTSRIPRTPKTTRSSSSVAFKSKRKEIADVSDDEHFTDSSEDYAYKSTKLSAKRRPRARKAMKESKTLSSPVNLISPTPSGPERKGTRESPRRSPRHIKERPPSKQRSDDVGADSSDDDFDDLQVSARTRGRTKRRTAANDAVTRHGPKNQCSSRQPGVESKGKSSRVEKRDTDMNLMDGEPKSPCDSSNDEDSDAAAEFPSQEQGSQPIDLNVKIVPKRKKAGPKVFLEREFHKLSPDELAIIRVAFIKRYPSPPSNMQAQGRYEAAHGTAMTSGMVQRTWETQLKPWSKRWWDFYLDFNQKVREKKAAKPRNKDPTLKENEVKSWVEEYYREHGDAKPNVTATATETATSTNM